MTTLKRIYQDYSKEKDHLHGKYGKLYSETLHRFLHKAGLEDRKVREVPTGRTGRLEIVVDVAHGEAGFAFFPDNENGHREAVHLMYEDDTDESFLKALKSKYIVVPGRKIFR